MFVFVLYTIFIMLEMLELFFSIFNNSFEDVPQTIQAQMFFVWNFSFM